MTTQPITVNYLPKGGEWLVVVTSGNTMLTDQAYGLIEARDRADRILEKLGKSAGQPVVHLLDGDAFAFTTAYLHARHGLTELPTATEPEDDGGVATQEFSLADLDASEEAEDQSAEKLTDHE